MSRRERERNGPLSRATKGVGTLIGLAAEAHAHHKNKKTITSPLPPQGNRTTRDNSSSTVARRSSQRSLRESHSDSKAAPRSHNTDDNETDYSSSLDDLLPPSYDEAIALVTSPATTIPSSSAARSEILPLPYPVVLPQRRPRNHSRGFIRAYAPILGTHKNISQEQFVAFLKDFQTSTRASPVLHAINIGAMAAGFAPSAIAMAVSISVQATTRGVMAMQVKGRTNGYLDKANRELFHPVGLHALITTFQPGQAGTQFVDVDATHGVSHNHTGDGGGSFQMPPSAPLIMVADADESDDLEPNASNQSSEPPSSWKRSGKFVASYLDRRAQAAHPDIYTNANQTQFASRYSDPTHPANSGSPLALLTGGIINLRDRDRGGGRQGLVSTLRRELTQTQPQQHRGIGDDYYDDDSHRRRRRRRRRRRSSSNSHSTSDSLARTHTSTRRGEASLPPRHNLRQVVRRATSMQQDVLYLVIAEIPEGALRA